MTDKLTEAKPWGTTTLLHQDDASQLSFIKVEAGGYSSRHLHTFKANVFSVVKGSLTIVTYRYDLTERERITLGPNQTVTVGPSVIHKFHANSYTECFELYYAPHGGKVSLHDIKRFDTNGRAEAET